jgi:hypothetical protein
MRKSLLLSILICSLLVLNGCGGGAGIMTTPPPTQIAISTQGGAQFLDTTQSLKVTATATNAPNNAGFDWALTCGGVNCGTITAHTASGAPATFVAPASAPTNSVIITAKLTGQTNSATAMVTVSPPPTVATTGTISAATLGSSYSLQLTASGGAGTLTWALGGGTSLPDTLSLNGTGMISGTPSGVSGPFNFKVHVTDSGSPQLTSPDVQLSITVGAPPISVAISPSSAYVKLNGSTKFVATLTNDQPTGNIDWSITLNGMSCPIAECGSVSPITTTTGVPTTYTAPASVPPANISLIATTVDGTPPATASATVTVGAHSFAPTKGSMETVREFHTATLLGNGNVLVAGGNDNTGKALASAELFDPTTGIFTPATVNMETARSHHTATLLNGGRVLVTGGLDSNNQPLSTAELFDPTTGKFTPASGKMASPRAYHTATLLKDGSVLVTGGLESGDTALTTAELFDPAAGTFTQTKGNMESGRFDHTATLLDHGSTLTNGRVLVTGGEKINRTQYATAELFDPATGTFAPANGDMETGRAFHTATLLNDGTVLVGGGLVVVGTNIYAALGSAELFDPNTGMFTPTKGSMNFARSNHTATFLNDGTVLVMGGLNRNTALATAELFGPVSGSFTRTADMATPRTYHTATLLNNGTVLVTGGVDGTGTALATAELYQ